MHIIHVYDGHEKVFEGRGSVPDVVWHLATQMVDCGHEVTVVERRWEKLAPTAEHDGVAFHRLSLSTGTDTPWTQVPYEMISHPVGVARFVTDRTNFALTALRLLRHLDGDVIHVHLPFAANVLTTVAPGLRSQMVYTAHLGETEKRVSEPRFSPDVYLAQRVAKTVALNPTMAQAFRSRGVSTDRLTVVPNGVDVDQFGEVSSAKRRAVARKYDVTSGPVALFVGSVTPRKGVTDLIEAVSLLRHGENERPDTPAQFVVTGPTEIEREYVARLRYRIDEVDIEDRVTFAGFVSEADLHALYDLADLFVLPSYEEGSSIAVAEAIAAGLPVIGTDIDGIRQQIEHGTHGLLFDPGDVETLRAHLRRLLTDGDERAAMSKAVTDRARERSWERVGDDMLRVYHEVAEEATTDI